MSPSGSAPTQARFWAHSSTASTVPAYGSQATRRPLPSIETAIDAPASCRCSTAASASLGPAHRARADDRVVLLEGPALAWRRSGRTAAPGAPPPASAPAAERRPVAVDPALGLGRLEVVEGAARRPAPRPASRRPPRRRAGPAGGRPSVTSPITAAPVSQRSQTASTSATRPGSTTASIRSCDSETMISNGSMSASRSGTRPTSMSIPTPPADAISPAEEVRPGGAEVLQRDEQPPREQLEAALEQLRLLERVADLHARALAVVALVELGRGEHRGAADPVAPGRGPDQDDRVAARPPPPARIIASERASPTHIALTRQFCSYGRLEVDLAADGRDPDRVAVVADPGDHALEQVARAVGVELAEAQRVEDRDRPSPEREDVAQDPADAGRRPLERLDRARVVVGLDLEGDRPAVADRRPRRRSRPGPSAPARPRSAAAAAACASACRRSARTTAG